MDLEDYAMKLVYVEFKSGGKQYVFYDNNLLINENDYVIVNTEKGMQYGRVVKAISGEENQEHSLVIRIADSKDMKQNEDNILMADEALEKAVLCAERLKLDMKFIDCYFTFDRKQLIYHFLADNRVDFRELAKELAYIYKTRIELRQVGARDKAKEISGIGICGRRLCCSSFLNDLDAVSISMVKNQDLSLNPSKINGCCGRLLCCLRYEDVFYTDSKKVLPSVNKKITCDDKFEGKVVSVNVFNSSYIVKNENGDEREYFVESRCDKCDRKCRNK